MPPRILPASPMPVTCGAPAESPVPITSNANTVGADWLKFKIKRLEGDLSCRLAHLKVLDDEYHRYVAHIVRKHMSSKAQMLLVSNLQEWEAYLTIDYKAKPLTRKNREGQSESFGKKGKSLFGLAAVFKIPEGFEGPLPEGTEREGDVLVAHVRVCCDDADQSCWHSAQVLTTALLLLRAQYPWLRFGNLYSDGATNFKSLLFTLMLPDIYARTGFRITSHVLPEAGDGKDRCDRDFAGVNRLFDSWVKVDRRVMMTANDICSALEAGKTTGVINCALQTERDKEEEQTWKDALDTGAFAQLAGKRKEDMFFTELVWEKVGVAWKYTGMRFFAYHLMGTGKFLTAEQLEQVHPGPRPKVLTYAPLITAPESIAGTALVVADPDGPVTFDKVKVEFGKQHKNRIRSVKTEKHQKAQMELEKMEQEKTARLIALRSSLHCTHCDRGFLGEFFRDTHESSCCDNKRSSVDQRKIVAAKQFEFDILKGHQHSLSSNSSVLVPMQEACHGCSEGAMQLLYAYKFSPITSHVPYSVACLLHGLVDTVVHNAGESRDVQLQGWACRESNVRPGNKFSDDVVALMRDCFNQKTRMNPYVMQSRLVSEFGQYSAKVLRPAQIAGWVTAEVGRRKKAAVAAALDATSVGAVEATDVQESDCVEGIDVMISIMQQAESGRSCNNSNPVPLSALGTERLQELKAAWRSKRPTEPTPARQPKEPSKRKPPEVAANRSRSEKRHKITENGGGAEKRKRSEALEKESGTDGSAPAEAAESGSSEKRKILSVVNKRGRRCEWEYECRWVGVSADETSWEPCGELAWPAAIVAVRRYEEKIKSQKAASILGGALSDKPWVRSKCCNTVVDPETCNSRDTCLPLDNAACIARRLKPLPRRRQA